MEWKLNEANQVPKGTILLKKGEKTEFLLLVIKGRVAAYNEDIFYMVSSGGLLGLKDMEEQEYSTNYEALENTIIMVWKNGGRRLLKDVLAKNANTSATLAIVMGRQLFESRRLYQSLLESAVKTYGFLKDTYRIYLDSGNEGRAQIQPIPAIDSLEGYCAEFDKEHGNIAEYYLAAARILPEIQKQYFSSSAIVSNYYICEGAKLLLLYVKECGKLMQYNENLMKILISSREDCFFKRVARRLLYLAQFEEKNPVLSKMLDDILEQINGLEALIGKNKRQAELPDRDAMEKLYYNVISGESKQEGHIVNAEQIMHEMENLTEKLLDFAQADDALHEQVKKTLEEFRNMKNKASTDDQARTLRRDILNWFFVLYEKVFLQEYEQKTGAKYIYMFLDYGVVDEKLLTQEELMELYYLENSDESNGQYPVYTMSQWLFSIMEERNIPSKNEFNMDYEEHLRDMKKTNSFSSPEEERDYRENPVRKVQFEIQNLYRTNVRILSGQPVIAVPFLYSGALQGTVDSMRINAQKIRTAFEEIRKIDFTLFARERMYAENELKLGKAYIMETIFPVCILFPTAGNNAIMWQELSGKRKNTQARFLFPILFNGMISSACTHLVGQFRWELVRTIQGTSWNDLRNKSMTSEYADYIQFYRKNRDLSEDRKEKLKIQLSKCRNNMREVFAEDYEIWIRSESSGAMRLTKPSREIMAMYCPFAKEIRQRLATQPAFADAMKRYTLYQTEKLKEVAFLVREYDKQNIPLPEVVVETKRFYEEN